MDEQAILRKNEIDANRGLLKGYLFTAGVMVVLFIGYVTGLFVAGSGTLLNVYVSFPIIVTFLVAGFFTGRTKLVAMKWFKYVLLFQYVFGPERDLRGRIQEFRGGSLKLSGWKLRIHP